MTTNSNPDSTKVIAVVTVVILGTATIVLRHRNSQLKAENKKLSFTKVHYTRTIERLINHIPRDHYDAVVADLNEDLKFAIITRDLNKN
jgi:hypothetical protein